MKNQKEASGISYSKIAKRLIFLVLVYGGYQFSALKKVKTSNETTQSVAESVAVRNEIEKQEALLPESESAPEDRSEMVRTESDPQQELKIWNHAEFEKLTQKTLQELPVLNDFKKLSQREVHHTPEIIGLAGDKLGLVAEVFDAHPEFAPEAQKFYFKCLSRKDLPASIRALCLANHRNLRVSKGESPEWRVEETRTTSQEVRDLADQVPLN